ncbi:hypothetical protein GRI58_12360 [Porphyrobacter algicida]|uniref:Lipoprotein n=1 Tax=Qipengyuania algicida TaxID=1836209 RepID=A0A845AJJ6_9SPHN|nr:hypothetical protein [Qipengyuania algicida]MXP29609.1 hypothetical protein [Qipengyuania algicida]
MRVRLIASIALLAAGCGSARSPIPEIAQGLPNNYSEGERVFDARLKARFPVGTSTNALAEELTKQGFSVTTQINGGGANYTDKGFLVSSVWNIGWKAQGGRITDIWGVYGGRGP